MISSSSSISSGGALRVVLHDDLAAGKLVMDGERAVSGLNW
jgi:hypothetical protein